MSVSTDLLSRECLEVCFVAPGESGPCTGFFGLAAKLPAECRAALKKEREGPAGLLAYHSSLATTDFDRALDQYNAENPLESSPILDPQGNPLGQSA